MPSRGCRRRPAWPLPCRRYVPCPHCGGQYPAGPAIDRRWLESDRAPEEAQPPKAQVDPRIFERPSRRGCDRCSGGGSWWGLRCQLFALVCACGGAAVGDEPAGGLRPASVLGGGGCQLEFHGLPGDATAEFVACGSGDIAPSRPRYRRARSSAQVMTSALSVPVSWTERTWTRTDPIWPMVSGSRGA